MIIKYLKLFLSLVATGFHFLFGGWTLALQAIIVLVVLDYATGFILAAKRGEIDSCIGRRGFVTKALYFVFLATLHLVDKGLGLPYPVLMTIGSWNLIIVEGTSIVENLGCLGVPIPQQLLDMFAKLKKHEHEVGI